MTGNSKQDIRSVEELVSLFNSLPDFIAQYDTELNPLFINTAYKANIVSIIDSIFAKNETNLSNTLLWEAELRKVIHSKQPLEFISFVKEPKINRYLSIKIIPQLNNNELKSLMVMGQDLSVDNTDNYFDLMLPVLNDHGLNIILQDLVKQLEARGLKVMYNNSEALKLVSRDKEVTIYRIVQELISNILKHSQATKVGLDIYYVKDELSIMLSDNGVGFDAELLKKDSKNCGLENIKAKLAGYNCTLTINSQVGKGTAVRIDIS